MASGQAAYGKIYYVKNMWEYLSFWYNFTSDNWLRKIKVEKIIVKNKQTNSLTVLNLMVCPLLYMK